MERIRVGAFELYPSERLLCAGGEPVELGARAFDLLLVLVENHGRLVTKATLLDRVWPRLVVDENNLPAQIASLRRVLGAGAIRTVPRFGYRLDLEVATPPAMGEPAPAAPPGLAAAPRIVIPRIAWPARLGPLIGRDEDLCAVEAALGRAPLVVVVGGAGVGKTRLAQEILARRAENPDGAVAWVSLEPIEGLERVPSAIALALGLALPEKLDGFAALSQALEQLSLLVILDGAEHLGRGFGTALAALVSQTRGLRVLVTSQAPLGIAGETVVRLSGLPVPDAGAAPADATVSAAVQLFALRATEADRRFELSAVNTVLAGEICRRLDGNPLALELAAARVPGLGLATLLARLDDRFRLLKHAARSNDPRHGVLQAALDWSYGLLSPAEQRVFNRLGAFAGSFALDAAARCVADPTL
ncbi:MAG: ATP-binding protein, partial [Steroidobacteraceae bacterium]